MSKLSFMKFFPADWINDTRELSPEAKGCWIDVLCLMWNAAERGVWKGTYQELARATGIPWESMPAIVTELARKVTTATFDGDETTLINRRMQREQKEHEFKLNRDARYRERHKNDGKTSRKTLDVRRQTPQDVRQKPTSTPARVAKKAAPAPVALKPYLKPDPATNPSGALICAYKERKGVGWDNRDWDRKHYGRAKKMAMELITTCGGLNAAWRCLKELGNRFTQKGLDWNMSTIVKHSDDWVAKQREENTSSGQEARDYASMGSQSVHSKDVVGRAGEQGSGFRTTGDVVGSIINRVRSHPDVRAEDEASPRLRDGGDDQSPQNVGTENTLEATSD